MAYALGATTSAFSFNPFFDNPLHDDCNVTLVMQCTYLLPKLLLEKRGTEYDPWIAMELIMDTQRELPLWPQFLSGVKFLAIEHGQVAVGPGESSSVR